MPAVKSRNFQLNRGQFLIRELDDRGSIAFTPEGVREVGNSMPLSGGEFGKRPRGHSSSTEVFVVHGHDHGVRDTVARFLEKLGLKPVILDEQPNKGRTLIEKFEAYSNVRFAVVLLTPDDMGASAKDLSNQQSRARENVILEFGYFIGRLGRESVCPMHIEGVELPSDIRGVVYVPFDHSGAWRLQLAKELMASGFQINLEKAL